VGALVTLFAMNLLLPSVWRCAVIVAAYRPFVTGVSPPRAWESDVARVSH
jgi:hypothetical protein